MSNFLNDIVKESKNEFAGVVADGVEAGDVIGDGPYRQSQNSKRPGCQVDYLVQTLTNNVFVCEHKTSL